MIRAGWGRGRDDVYAGRLSHCDHTATPSESLSAHAYASRTPPNANTHPRTRCDQGRGAQSLTRLDHFASHAEADLYANVRDLSQADPSQAEQAVAWGFSRVAPAHRARLEHGVQAADGSSSLKPRLGLCSAHS